MIVRKGETWERPQNPTQKSLCLEEGKTYTFLMSESEEASSHKKNDKKEDAAAQVL